MCQIRTAPPKDEREYPLVITAEEKDKVLNYILVVANGKRTAKLNYKDIPDLRTVSYTHLDVYKRQTISKTNTVFIVHNNK